MSGLTFDTWTVMADRPADQPERGWMWRNREITHGQLLLMCDRNDAVMMQRIRDGKKEAIARLAGPNWKRLQTRFVVQDEFRRVA